MTTIPVSTDLALYDIPSLAPIDMPDVYDDELDIIRELAAIWRAKLYRNQLRSAYFDGTRAIRSLGISVPPRLHWLKAVLGWPEKTCRALAMRNMFEGFVTPGSEQDPFELAGLLEENRFDIELPQTIMSAYKHSCSFVSITLGVESTDPDVLITPRSAEFSSAIWDRRRRSVSAAMAITEIEKNRLFPSAFIVYLPDVTLEATKAGGHWTVDRYPNPIGVPLVEPLAYDPQLDRPFGRSRISRPVMNITDRAARTLVRTEVHAEFFSAPQRYAAGADDDAFKAGRWQAVMGRFINISKDEDGDVPTLGQFPQVSMQPHSDMLRMLAAQFAGETGLPISSLGIISDNPASAEAIYAAKEDLVVEAGFANRSFGGSLKRIAQKAVMLRDGLDEPTPELRRLVSRWRNPAFPSPVSAADALVKLQTVFPWIGESEVALEMVGFSEAEITRLLADKRRAQGAGLLDAIAARTGQPPAAEQASPVETSDPEDADEMKKKFDALGVAVRAGVDPSDAARRLGLDGLALTGAVPVSLRLPESDAGGLEEK